MLLGINPLVLGGRGACFCAQATVTAPVIWSTAAGTGGPLLYNGSPTGHGGVTAFILAMSYGLTVASTVAGAIGLTGGVTTAPSSTTVIDSVANLHIGGQAPLCTAYRIGTPSAAGTFFLPTGHVHTGAITVDTDDDNWIHLGGVIEVPPGSFVSPSASATLTTAVIQIGLVWMELPNA